MSGTFVLLMTSLAACAANIPSTFETTGNEQNHTISDSGEVPSSQKFDLLLTFLDHFGHFWFLKQDHVEITFQDASRTPCLYFRIWDRSVEVESVSGMMSTLVPSSLSKGISTEHSGVRFWIDWSGGNATLGMEGHDEIVRVSFNESSCAVDHILATQRGDGTVRWEVGDPLGASSPVWGSTVICKATDQEALGIKTTTPNRWKVDGQKTQMVYARTKADVRCGSNTGLRLYVNENEVFAGNDCGPVLQECTPLTSSATESGTLCQFECLCVDGGSCKYLYMTEARAQE